MGVMYGLRLIKNWDNKTSKTFNSALNIRQPTTFNHSKYYIRNGSGVQSSTCNFGNIRFSPMNLNEQYNYVLKAFHTINDTLGGIFVIHQ